MKRGMTLLETVLALVLLGAISVATAALVGTAARGLTPISADREWELAAREALRCIHDDLAIGDYHETKAWVDDSGFTIRTRPPRTAGSTNALVRYRLDRAALLTRSTDQTNHAAVPILGRLAAFDVSPLPGGGWLVTLRSTTGAGIAREFVP